MAPLMERHRRNAAKIPHGALALLAVMLAGCSHGEAFVAADYARCQQLGFQSGSREYDVCLTEVQRQRTTFAGAAEPIVR